MMKKPEDSDSPSHGTSHDNGEPGPESASQTHASQASDDDLLREMKRRGWRERIALIQLDVPPTSGEPGVRFAEEPAATSAEHDADASSAESMRKEKQRERKDRQREKQWKEHGWRQLNIVVPDEARDFMQDVARHVRSKKMLNTLRTAFSDPDVVRVGRKVRRLRGEAGETVRRLLQL